MEIEKLNKQIILFLFIYFLYYILPKNIKKSIQYLSFYSFINTFILPINFLRGKKYRHLYPSIGLYHYIPLLFKNNELANTYLEQSSTRWLTPRITGTFSKNMENILLYLGDFRAKTLPPFPYVLGQKEPIFTEYNRKLSDILDISKIEVVFSVGTRRLRIASNISFFAQRLRMYCHFVCS